jgi:tetratricopeptide (TPR) repeat protein
MTTRRRPEDPEKGARRALADAEKAARARPEDSALQLHVADCSLRLGEVLQQRAADEAARRCFERARRIAETEHEAAISRGEDHSGHPARSLLASAWIATGTVLQHLGSFADSAKAFRTAIDKLGPLEPNAPRDERERAERVGQAHGSLAVALDEAGESDEAFGHYRLSLGIAEAVHAAFPDDPRALAALALAHNGIAHHYGETDRFVDAGLHHDASRRLNERLLEQRPNDEHAAFCLATDFENLCDLAWRRTEFEDALAHGRRALEIRAALCDRFGTDAAAEWLEQLADSHRDVAELLQELERGSEAIRHHRAAHRLAERLRATWPEAEEYQFRVADSLLLLGDALEQERRTEEALDAYRAARRADQELIDGAPDELRYHANAAQCEMRTALLLLRAGREAEAQRAIEAGLGLLETQLARHADDRGLTLDLSRFHADVAGTWLNLAEREAAEHHLRASLKIDRRLLQQDPHDEATLAHLAITYDTLAALREEAGDYETARKFCTLAVRAEEALIATDPESSEYQVRLVQAILNLAGVLHAMDLDDDAQREVQRAEKHCVRLQRLLPDDPEVRGLSGQLARIRGSTLRDRDDLDGARRALDEAVATFDDLRSRRARVTNLDNHFADALEARLELAVTAAEVAPRAEGDRLDALVERAIAVRRELAASRNGDVLAWHDLARVLELGSDALEVEGNYEQAASLRREAEELNERYGRDP